MAEHRLRPYGFEKLLKKHQAYAQTVMAAIAERGPLADAVLNLAGDGPHHVGVDEARTYRVHPDAVPGQFQGARSRESDDTGLRGRVVALADCPGLGDDGRDVDDAPATALDHVRHNQLRVIEDTGQIHRDYAVPVLKRELSHGAITRDARVVHEDVDLTESLDHRFHELGGLLTIRGIALQDLDAVSQCLELFADVESIVPVLQIVDDDVGAAPGQLGRDRTSDTP